MKNFWIKPLVGGLEHFLCSPILGMMIQSDSYFLDKKTIGLSVLRFIILYSGYNDLVSTDNFWKIMLEDHFNKPKNQPAFKIWSCG